MVNDFLTLGVNDRQTLAAAYQIPHALPRGNMRQGVNDA